MNVKLPEFRVERVRYSIWHVRKSESLKVEIMRERECINFLKY